MEELEVITVVILKMLVLYVLMVSVLQMGKIEGNL